MKKLIPFFAFVLVITSCQKEITVDLPITDPKLVVEGTIENGQRPLIILTVTQSYFAPTDINSIAAMFVRDAVITINDGTSTYQLLEISSELITDEQLEEAAASTLR